MSVSEGQKLAAELRRYFSIGTRTRRFRLRDGYRQDLHADMVEAIMNAVQYPGYFSDRVTALLRPGWGPALAYGKHVRGYRIDGTLAYRINSMTAWQFAALLGEMANAGVSVHGRRRTVLRGR